MCVLLINGQIVATDKSDELKGYAADRSVTK